MRSRARKFLSGFFIGLGIFLALNLAAAQFRSDCGLPAVFGVSSCADDIIRVGFPMIFLERGGFAYHESLDPALMLADIAVGIAVSVGIGFWLARKK